MLVRVSFTCVKVERCFGWRDVMVKKNDGTFHLQVHEHRMASLCLRVLLYDLGFLLSTLTIIHLVQTWLTLETWLKS